MSSGSSIDRLDIFEASDQIAQLFDKAKLDALALMLPTLKDRPLFDTKVRAAASAYLLFHQFRIGQRPNDVRSELETISKRLADVRQAYRSLSDEARAAIHSAAAVDRAPPTRRSPWVWLEPPELPSNPASRVAWTERIFLGAERWLRDAYWSIPSGSRGRPRNDDERHLVQSLADLWEVQTGRWPTTEPGGEGLFAELCRAVTTPICEMLGLSAPNLSKQIQQVIYCRSAGQK